jgi:hypothetical protein
MQRDCLPPDAILQHAPDLMRRAGHIDGRAAWFHLAALVARAVEHGLNQVQKMPTGGVAMRAPDRDQRHYGTDAKVVGLGSA